MKIPTVKQPLVSVALKLVGLVAVLQIAVTTSPSIV